MDSTVNRAKNRAVEIFMGATQDGTLDVTVTIGWEAAYGISHVDRIPVFRGAEIHLKHDRNRFQSTMRMAPKDRSIMTMIKEISELNDEVTQLRVERLRLMTNNDELKIRIFGLDQKIGRGQ